MARLRYNGLSTTLGSSLTSGATSVTFGAALTHSNGTAVPTISGSDYIPLSILDSAGKLAEVVYLTAYTSGATTGTITRGQEGTPAASRASGQRVTLSMYQSDVDMWSYVTVTPGDLNQTSGTVTSATSGGNRWACRRFGPTGTNLAAGVFHVPADWKTVDVVMDWCSAGASGGNVRWGYTLESAAAGDNLATSGSGADQTVAAGGQDILVRTTLATGLAVTPGNLSQIRIVRRGDDAADTATNSADVLRLLITRAS